MSNKNTTLEMTQSANADFKREFFKIYDRKVAAGEIVFADLGISKTDFTGLCSDETFQMTQAELRDICGKMKLSEAETERLLSCLSHDEK